MKTTTPESASLATRPAGGSATRPAGGLAVRRMSGLGNRFAVIDARKAPIRLSAATRRAMAAEETRTHPEGAGLDQIIVLEPPRRGGDLFMRIYNAAGDEVEACGNATRAVAGRLFAERGGDRAILETCVGDLTATPEGEAVRIDMGQPLFDWRRIPLATAPTDVGSIPLSQPASLAPLPPDCPPGPFGAVNIGNPHAVFWVEDPASVPLERVGPALERHPFFPEGVNVSPARIVSPTLIVLRVWERGAGLTRACGTAACAAAALAMRDGRVAARTAVRFPEGDLHIERRSPDGPLFMIGPWRDEGPVFYRLNADDDAADDDANAETDHDR